MGAVSICRTLWLPELCGVKILLDDVQTKKQVTFREATAADIPALANLAREAHLEGRFRDIPFSPRKAENCAREAILEKRNQCIFLAISESDPVGLLWVSTGGYLFGEGGQIATIQAIFVCSKHRNRMNGGSAALGLMSGARSWAIAKGAKEILLHTTLGINSKRTHKFVKRLGFETVGGSYSYDLAR